MKHLHLTIGPVQDFVARARRTRDLLAGSFLLSFLAGHAMAEIIRVSGQKIVFPDVHDDQGIATDPLLQAIMQSEKEEEVNPQPWIGSLPNRFQAQVYDDFQPEQVVQAVKGAWQKIANAVWDHVLAPIVSPESLTRAIWERQVENFWEINWVIGDESHLLDRRKYWRSYVPTTEGGDKCILMSHLQELSGYQRIRERKQQDQFWWQVREKVGDYQLNEKDRLSAIGLIKRLYPLVAKEALGWELPTQAIRFPSTYSLAAFPWILRALQNESQKAQDFARLAMQNRLPTVSAIQLFPSLKKQIEQTPEGRGFASLDGRILFPSPLARESEHLEQKVQKKLQSTLSQLIKAMKGEPPTYYALLLMDGDQLGKMLQSHSSPKVVSQALADFTDGLAQEVSARDGITVYAGGDDVLALMPVQSALAIAVNLREKYQQAFRKKKMHATLSAGLVFAHYHAPLQDVVKYGHHLLDDIAKSKTGRDSLAVGIYRTSGPDLVWSAPWEMAYDQTDEQRVTRLEQLAEQMNTDEALVSSQFLYKLRKLYDQTLCLPDLQTEQKEKETPSPLFVSDEEESKQILVQLLTADYLRIKGWHPKWDPEEVQKRMEAIVELCQRHWYTQEGEERTLHHSTGDWSSDGVLLARFLAQKEEVQHA
jgi:CRISPR-associated protein Cmr2